MAHLEIRCLGVFYASLNGDLITSFGTEKTRALLAYLAVEPNQIQERSTLGGLLWPDMAERNALHNLRQSLLTLRKALHNDEWEKPFLIITRESVQLNMDADVWVDVRAFQDGYQAANLNGLDTSQGRPNIFMVQDALMLYRGDFLDQFSLSGSGLFEEWASVQREFFARQVVNAFALLIDYHERRLEYGLALQAAQKLVRTAPWEEDIHREIMRLNYIQGRPGAALSQYQSLRRLLKEELEINPASETMALFEMIRSGIGDLGHNQLRCSPAVHNLPLTDTPLIGRQLELKELGRLVVGDRCRLITIHGPGGIGKTRLAVELGYSQVGIFKHGVFFVSLSSLSAGDQLIPAIASVLGISFVGDESVEKQVVKSLRNRDLLLILDNFEHLIPAAEILVEILGRAPGLVLLVTSRIRLNLHAERVYTLRGLDYPVEHDVSGHPAEDYAAVKLFLERAQKVRHGFELTSARRRSAIMNICRMLDGVPLGIELAASGMWANTPEELAVDLRSTLDSLHTSSEDIPSRHRSMRAAFESSWKLLTVQEKNILSRLSVFHVGFDRKAAEEVTGTHANTLAILLDKSLIHRNEAGRYHIHQVVRQFASEKLSSDPFSREELYSAHARYYARFLASRRESLFGKLQRKTLDELSVDLDNARHAWMWALGRCDREVIEACVDPLYGFYYNSSRFQEGVEIFSLDHSRLSTCIPESLIVKIQVRQAALQSHLSCCDEASRTFEKSLSVFERERLYDEEIFTLVMMANLAQRQGDWQQAQQLAEKSLERARMHENAWGVAHALYISGFVHYRSGDIVSGRKLVQESLSLGPSVNDARLLGAQMYTLGDIACHLGNFDEAVEMFKECLMLSEELKDRYNTALHLNNLGTVYHVQADYEQARACYRRSFDLYREIGDLRGQALLLSNLGEIATAHGDLRTAEGMYCQALETAREIPDQWVILACLNNLAESACLQGHFSQARMLLAEAVEIAVRTNTHPMLMKLLVNLARYFAHVGDSPLVMDMLQLAQEHPASEMANRKKAAAVAAGINLMANSGRKLNLDQIVARVRSGLRM